MDSKQAWLKKFYKPDMSQYFEEETLRKMSGVNLEIMKFANSTDPQSMYDPRCWCEDCEQIKKVIKRNAWRAHISKESNQ